MRKIFNEERDRRLGPKAKKEDFEKDDMELSNPELYEETNKQKDMPRIEMTSPITHMIRTSELSLCYKKEIQWLQLL